MGLLVRLVRVFKPDSPVLSAPSTDPAVDLGATLRGGLGVTLQPGATVAPYRRLAVYVWRSQDETSQGNVHTLIHAIKHKALSK
jgi:hypothetical protein